MAINSLDDLRRKAPEEFRNLSDEDLVREYSRQKNLPFADVADRLGVKPRGTFSEMVRQGVGGLVVDIPKMGGQFLEYTGLAPEYGRELSQAAKARAYQYEPDVRGRGLLGEAGVLGARGLAPVAATLPLAFVPGGQFAAPAAAATLFGTSAAQETYDKLREQGASEEDAAAAARRVLALQGPFEGVASAVGLRAVRPLATAVRGAPRTTAGVAGALTDTAVLRPLAKGMGINLAVQPTTEVVQDVGTELIERSYGAQPEDIGDIARQSALGGFGLTMLLGPLAAGASVSRARRAATLKEALYGENTDPAVRAKAMDLVMAEARRQGVDERNVDQWFDSQLQLEDARTEALRQAEETRRNEERIAQIDLLGGEAQQLEGLQTQAFGSLAQQRAIEEGMAGLNIPQPFGSLETQRTFEQDLTRMREDRVASAGQQYQDLMGQRAAGLMAAQEAGQQAQEVMAPQARGLEAAETVGTQWQEMQADRRRQLLELDDIGQQWQKMQENLPKPVSGRLTARQRQALRGPSGEAAIPTTPRTSALPEAEVTPLTTLLSQPPVSSPLPAATPAPSSLLSERPAPAAPSPAVVSPVEGTPSGASRTVKPAAPQGAAGASSAPVSAGSVVKVNDTEVTLDEAQAEAWNQAQESYDGKVRRAKAITNYQERDGALRAAGMQLSAVRRQITGALTAKERAAAGGRKEAEIEEGDDALAKLLADVDVAPLKGENILSAAVQGKAGIKPPGRVSLSLETLRNIRNSLIDQKKPKSEQESRIVSAINAFTEAYKVYLDKGGTARTLIGTTEKAEMARIKRPDAVGQELTRLELYANNVQQTLTELGRAVGGNAKDVEAIVRLVKDMAQGRIVAPRKTRSDVIKAGKKLDTMLSQAWAAAKSEAFRVAGEPDLAYVRPGESRVAKEQEGKPSPLELAVSKGVKVGKSDRIAKGVAGALQYLINSGTPFERMLGTVLRDTLEDQDSPVKIKFITKGNSNYDPKTDTINLRKDASPEVQLHEILHAALQSFVYNNPKDPAVLQLKKSLKQVLSYKGELSPKAKEVQDLLQRLVSEKNELDAVLELISYNATLNEFRRAMQAMPSKGVPAAFRVSVSKLWNAIKTMLRRMLGVKDSLASDILDSSVDLLERSRKGTGTRGQGNVLEAAVTSDTAIPSKESAALTPQFQNPLTNDQYKKLSKTLLPEWISSKFLFDMLGWAKVPGKVEGASQKITDFIEKNSPGASKVASWFNSHFGLQSGVIDALVQAKDDRRGGSMIYEQIAKYFTDLPPLQSVAVLEYMDNRLAFLRKQGAEPAFPGTDMRLKDLADATIDKWWEYAKALRDPRQRDGYAGIEQPGGRWTGGVKFSQGLAFAESVDQIASPSFGVRNISKLISTRTKDEVNEDAIAFRKDANGDAILTDKFVGLYKLTPALKQRLNAAKTDAEASQILAELKPDEFISAEKIAEDGKPMYDKNGVELAPDRNYLWDLKEKAKGGYRFTARLDAKQALLTKKGQDLGYALQNTMSILAGSYSSTRLTEALAAYEQGTPNAVAFNNLADLNAMLNGEYKGNKFEPNTDAASWSARIKPDQLVKLSATEASSETVKGLYRNRHQWVQLPNGPTYGALAGKIVNGSVWSAIEDMSDRRPLVNMRAYNNVMRWFKKSKTVYNPATWGTNVASNFTMSMLDDIPLPTVGYAAKLYVGYMLPPAMSAKLGIALTREQQQLMLEIMKTNALLGDFSSNELKQSIYDSMRSTIGDSEQGVAERVMQFMKMEKDRIESIQKLAGKGKDAAEKADQLAADWYSMQDNIFRVASMLNNLGQQAAAGKPIDAEAYRLAGDHARFAFLDYDIDSKAIRIMRQTAFPFISWPYAAAKLIGRIAVHKPWKLVNLYAGYWMLDAMLQALTGDDDDELRTAGPEWARDKLLFGLGPHTHVRVPFLGDSENPVYYGLGKYVIPSSFGERIPNGFLGQSWWPSFVSPGGPFISAAVGLVGGVDPYNGKALSPPVADNWENLTARLAFAQSLFAPNLPFLNAREFERAKEAMTATTDRSENYSSLYMARLAGMRFYDFNVQGSLDAQDRAAKAVERDYKTEIGKIRRKMERHENPDWDAFYEREAELVKRMEERIAKIRGAATEED